MKKQGVVYTCLTGNYDVLREHRYIDKDWDYVCFTDNEKLIAQKKVGVWEIRPLVFSGKDNTRNSRFHKINPHKLFPEYEQSIWCDSNIGICSPYIFKQIEERKADFLVPIHFCRNCIYDEFFEVEKLGYDAKDVIEKQKRLVENDGFPKNWGLAETNILYRKHKLPEIIKVMDMWWSFIRDFSKRDQLSFTYVLWKNGFNLDKFFIKNTRLSLSDFDVYPHNPKVLIVGGASFIGSAVADRMLQIDSKVIVIDDFRECCDVKLKKQNVARNCNNENYKFYQGDACDGKLLERVFEKNKPNVVFYFGNENEFTSDVDRVKADFDGIFNVLENMRKFRVRKLVFGSFVADYGKVNGWFLNEKQNISKPLTLDGAIKSSCEILIYSYAKSFDLSAICLRFFNLLGPNPSENSIVGKLLNSVKSNEKIRLPFDIRDKRDFVYIDDIVDGIEKAWKCSTQYDIFNLASGKALRIEKLVKLVEKFLGRKIDVEFLASKTSRIKRKVANISKAKKYLGYSPKFSVEEAIERTIKESDFL